MPEDRIEFATMPSIENLEDTLRTKVSRLLEELDEVVDEKAHLLVREDELKDQLEALQKESHRQGFRFGKLVFCSQAVAGRKTLDKMLLLENGCPAAALQASYKQGAPSVRNTFKRLDDYDVA